MTLITDGGYGGGDNTELAREKDINIVITAMIGKDAPDVFADFQFSEDGTKLEKCAAGASARKVLLYENYEAGHSYLCDGILQRLPLSGSMQSQDKNGKVKFITSMNTTHQTAPNMNDAWGKGISSIILTPTESKQCLPISERTTILKS